MDEATIDLKMFGGQFGNSFQDTSEVPKVSVKMSSSPKKTRSPRKNRKSKAIAKSLTPEEIQQLKVQLQADLAHE